MTGSPRELEARRRGLSPRGYGLVLSLSLVVFLFWGGGIWADPFTVDARILWSYAVIPPLVAAALLLQRRWGWGSWCLDTGVVTLAKFAVTYSLAAVMWGITDPPPAPARPTPDPFNGPGEPAQLFPSPRLPEETGTIRGVVRDRLGSPRAGVLIYVARGHESFRYPPPEVPSKILHRGSGFGGRRWIVQTFQPLELASSDGRLHTLEGRNADGGLAFNYPLLASGRPRSVTMTTPHGVLSLSCRAHPGETWGELVVLAHPLWTITDDQGRYQLGEVPAGPLTLRARFPHGGVVDQVVHLRPGGEIRAEIGP